LRQPGIRRRGRMGGIAERSDHSGAIAVLLQTKRDENLSNEFPSYARVTGYSQAGCCNQIALKMQVRRRRVPRIWRKNGSSLAYPH
jgi:hypothetical protein